MLDNKNPHGIKKGQVLWHVSSTFSGRPANNCEVTVTFVSVARGAFYANECKFKLDDLREISDFGCFGRAYINKQAWLDDVEYKEGLKHIANATGVGRFGDHGKPKITQDQAKRIMAILKENEETKNHQ